MFAIVDRSNYGSDPGPQPRFIPRSYPSLVTHFSVID
jgi:hypothetical protein